ncbi:MAG TPA: SMP-30/gluconolactonase/LRE family protein [Gemmatimonadales bacterium]|jgi:sugar lactone lactonase YvrE
MRRLLISLVAALMLTSAQPVLAAQPEQGVVRDFANLATADCHNPEGIAVSPTGTLYAAGLSGKICVVTQGQVTRVIPVPPGPAGVTNLLGELFEPSQGLFVVDIADFGVTGSGRLLLVDPDSGLATTLADGFLAPNAIAQNRHRTLFVSDSFAGAIFTVEPTGGGKKLWKADPKLSTKGSPPFGANGLAFDRTEGFLYVANTGDSTILRIPVNADGTAGDVAVFAKGATAADPQLLHGADGILFDVTGQLWVCANQASEIQVLSPSGALVARFGHNSGDDAMVFPASLVFHERALYVTNLYFGSFGGKLSVLGVPFPGAPLRP